MYRGIEATPIVVDGIMYVSGPWSMVYAIDVRKGEIIWIYDPEVPREYGVKACCDAAAAHIPQYYLEVISQHSVGELEFSSL